MSIHNGPDKLSKKTATNAHCANSIEYCGYLPNHKVRTLDVSNRSGTTKINIKQPEILLLRRISDLRYSTSLFTYDFTICGRKAI